MGVLSRALTEVLWLSWGPCGAWDPGVSSSRRKERHGDRKEGHDNLPSPARPFKSFEMELQGPLVNTFVWSAVSGSSASTYYVKASPGAPIGHGSVMVERMGSARIREDSEERLSFDPGISGTNTLTEHGSRVKCCPGLNSFSPQTALGARSIKNADREHSGAYSRPLSQETQLKQHIRLHKMWIWGSLAQSMGQKALSLEGSCSCMGRFWGETILHPFTQPCSHRSPLSSLWGAGCYPAP